MMLLNMQQEVRQAMELCGGMTASIFPEVEAWLLTLHERQEALEYVAVRKKMDRYRSVVDFLFCEIITEYRKHCFRFYLNGGPPLRDMITIEQRHLYAWTLLKAIEHAYEAMCHDRSLTWQTFRQQVLEATAS